MSLFWTTSGRAEQSNEIDSHLDDTRAVKDSIHICASSGCGLTDKGESEARLRRNPDFKLMSRILDLHLSQNGRQLLRIHSKF